MVIQGGFRESCSIDCFLLQFSNVVMAAIDEVLSAKCFDTLQIQQPAHQTSEIMQIPQRRLSDK